MILNIDIHILGIIFLIYCINMALGLWGEISVWDRFSFYKSSFSLCTYPNSVQHLGVPTAFIRFRLVISCLKPHRLCFVINLCQNVDALLWLYVLWNKICILCSSVIDTVI